MLGSIGAKVFLTKKVQPLLGGMQDPS